MVVVQNTYILNFTEKGLRKSRETLLGSNDNAVTEYHSARESLLHGLLKYGPISCLQKIKLGLKK